MSYVNNAYTTVLKPEGVKNAAPADAAEAKAKIAALFNVKNPENVIFTRDEIQAMNIAMRSLIKPGDHIITTVYEQVAVLQLLDELKAECVEVTYIGVNPYGELKYDEIEGAVKENTVAMVICHGSNLTGNLTDMERVTTIARRHKLIVISDGSQSAGAAVINLEAMGVDVFCFSGHRKLMGPYGIGGLCIKESIKLDQKLVDSVGEIDGKLYGGLCAALDFIKEKGIYGISIFPHRLAKRFFESVSSMDKVTVYGDFGTGNRIPTVAIKVEGFTPEEVKRHMRKNHIAVSCSKDDAPMLHRALGTA
ncbi:MAG: aminotransferase class V-fold PLP-dependent enzyme, partial [Firmicutes bacterium]|nr:aminotransferase class V-fold PLP-dependent enzyme [Bacillota bacterium]